MSITIFDRQCERPLAAAFAIALLCACGQQSEAIGGPRSDDMTAADASEVRPIGPDMSIGEWNAAGPQMQVSYFRGAVSMHITDPARNDTQRRFDDNLALDLRDCVTALIEQSEPQASDTVRPFITQCLETSGMPPPG